MRFPSTDVLGWSDDCSLPLLPSNFSAEVFGQLRKSPRLDLFEEGHWRARPDREMDASLQKHMMDLDSKNVLKDFGLYIKVGVMTFGNQTEVNIMHGQTQTLF